MIYDAIVESNGGSSEFSIYHFTFYSDGMERKNIFRKKNVEMEYYKIGPKYSRSLHFKHLLHILSSQRIS